MMDNWTTERKNGIVKKAFEHTHNDSSLEKTACPRILARQSRTLNAEGALGKHLNHPVWNCPDIAVQIGCQQVMASRSMYYRCTPIASGDLIVLLGQTMKVAVCMSINGAPAIVADIHTRVEKNHLGAVKLRLSSAGSIIDLAAHSGDGIYHKACWCDVEADVILALL